MKADIPEFAVHWVRQLGAPLLSLERLRGGINNHVFRCGHSNQHWLIKGYPPANPGERDRMQAEVDFLRFAAQAAPGFTPALLQVDPIRRCIVMEYLEGETFREGVPPSDAAVGDAVEFFRQLNAEPRLARESIQLDAAEGFLSLREHLRNVRERLERMTCAHLEPELRPQAETLLRQLHCELAQTEEDTSNLINQGIVTDVINPEERCVSPSDFGFHNAILTAAGTRFIDFEFAGWDDPAKASQDFILQPRIPVSKPRSPLLEALSLKHRSCVLTRCKAMGPILKIKWLCILLAVLQPVRLEQILIVMPEEELCTLIHKRLEKASCYWRKFQ